MRKLKTFKHNGKTYSLKHYSRWELCFVVVFLDDIEVGRIKTKHKERVTWAQRSDGERKSIDTPMRGMRKPEIIRHCMNWIADKDYVIPDTNEKPKARTGGWKIDAMSDEEKKKL